MLPSSSHDNKNTLNQSNSEDTTTKKSVIPPVLNLITTSSNHTAPCLSPKVITPTLQSPRSPKLSLPPVLNPNNPFISLFTASKLSPTESKSLPPTNPFHGASTDKPNPFLSLSTVSNPFHEFEGSKSHAELDSLDSVSDKSSSISQKSPAIPLAPIMHSSPVADKQPPVTTSETCQHKVSRVSFPAGMLERVTLNVEDLDFVKTGNFFSVVTVNGLNHGAFTKLVVAVNFYAKSA
jgi:hypothetical protein